MNEKDANDSFNIFHEYLNNQLNEIAPITTIEISSHKLIRNEWITTGLMKCLTKQKKLYKKTLQNCSTKNDHEKYRVYGNNLQKVLRKAKESYYKGKCIDFKKNTSKLWKMINKITNKTRDKATVIEDLKIDNIETYNAKEIATEFAKYFSTVGATYANRTENPTQT